MVASSPEQKALRLLQMVDDMCRRAGGKQLLTADEYLEIVNYCYLEVYGVARSSDDEVAAQTAS